MASIVFPSSPALNDVFTSGARSWTWTGSRWKAIPATICAYASAAGTTYLGTLPRASIPAAPALPETVSNWTIHRTTLTPAGAVTATAKATNVAWIDRETATYT